METVKTNRYFVGLDLGPPGEHTALAVLERPFVEREWTGERRRPSYALRHLQRFQLGTPFPEIVSTVRTLLKTPQIHGARLVVDKTGVGQAITRLFSDDLQRSVTCTWIPVHITGAAFNGPNDGRIRIPKQELVGTVQVLLQTRRLQIAKALPDSDLMVRELESFRVKPPPKSDDPMAAWRDGPHDDLIFAVAMAGWVGEKCLSGLPHN